MRKQQTTTNSNKLQQTSTSTKLEISIVAAWVLKNLHLYLRFRSQRLDLETPI
ncbi:hypothetical protein Hanom_Chr04g00338551 [Helianthus anomalus]